MRKPAPRRVTGRTITLHGRVVRSDDGTPVAGATISTLAEAARGRGRVRVLRRTTTDSDGRYCFRFRRTPARGLPFDFVRFDAPGLERVTLWTEVARRATYEFNIRLHPGTAVVGRVSRRDGRRIPLQVSVVRADQALDDEHPEDVDTEHPEALPARRTSAPWRADVASDGTFRVEGVRAGADLVLGASSDTEGRLEPVVRVAAADAATRIADLVVAPPALVRVRVLDDAGRPIAAAEVRAGGTPGFARTDEDGRGAVRARDGSAIFVRHDDFLHAHDVVRADRTSEIEVRLDAGATLVGRIADSAGRPVAGAEVLLVRRDGTFHDPRPVHSAADGTFHLGHAPTRDVEASVTASGFVAQIVPLPAPGQSLDIRLTRPATLRLRLVTVDRRPAPNVAWMRFPTWVAGPRGGMPERVEVLTMDVREGLVEVRGLPPVPWSMSLWAPGFDAVELPMHPAEGEALDLGEIVLTPCEEGAEVRPAWLVESGRA